MIRAEYFSETFKGSSAHLSRLHKFALLLVDNAPLEIYDGSSFHVAPWPQLSAHIFASRPSRIPLVGRHFFPSISLGAACSPSRICRLMPECCLCVHMIQSAWIRVVIWR